MEDLVQGILAFTAIGSMVLFMIIYHSNDKTGFK